MTGARPDPALPWREAAYCVVDLETTGLDARRDEIVSWAAVPVVGGRVVAGAARAGLVRPEGPVPARSIRIHGLRPHDLAGAPGVDRMLDELLPALDGAVPVFHVDWVERGFLGPALRRRGRALAEPVLDTARLACAWDAGLPYPVSLSALARRLGLPVQREHDAAGDALTTAQVLLALASQLERRDGAPLTLGRLCELGTGPPERRLARLLRRRG